MLNPNEVNRGIAFACVTTLHQYWLDIKHHGDFVGSPMRDSLKAISERCTKLNGQIVAAMKIRQKGDPETVEDFAATFADGFRRVAAMPEDARNNFWTFWTGLGAANVTEEQGAFLADSLTKVAEMLLDAKAEPRDMEYLSIKFANALADLKEHKENRM